MRNGRRAKMALSPVEATKRRNRIERRAEARASRPEPQAEPREVTAQMAADSIAEAWAARAKAGGPGGGAIMSLPQHYRGRREIRRAMGNASLETIYHVNDQRRQLEESYGELAEGDSPNKLSLVSDGSDPEVPGRKAA
jgi:hypothetical protein